MVARRRTPRRRTPAQERERHLRRTYGLTLLDYEAMFWQQDGVCRICHRPERSLGRTGRLRPLSVDHDHDTGKVRGLLCHGCNTALGKFNHDPEMLHAAIRYLEENA